AFLGRAHHADSGYRSGSANRAAAAAPRPEFAQGFPQPDEIWSDIVAASRAVRFCNSVRGFDALPCTCAARQPVLRAWRRSEQLRISRKKPQSGRQVLIFGKNGTYIACVDARGVCPRVMTKGKVVSHGTTRRLVAIAQVSHGAPR